MPIVLAAMQDKDVEGMVRPLVPVASCFITTTVKTPRALLPDALAARIAAVHPGVEVTPVPEPQSAMREAFRRHPRAVAAGSIYFIGPLRARLIESGALPI